MPVQVSDAIGATMTERLQQLQDFIDATEAAAKARGPTLPIVTPMADKLFSALSDVHDHDPDHAPRRQPVCEHLETAYDLASRAPDPVPEMAKAFAALEPYLNWAPKPGTENEPNGFFQNHANASIVGVGGLEVRDDVRIGTSLVAPHQHYPRHNHPPEEFYVVLSPGAWMHEDGPFQELQAGDLFHNTPHVWHAMQAGETPLLAVWCLWTKDAS